MKQIIEILMRRDGLTYEDAKEAYLECQEAMLEAVEEDGLGDLLEGIKAHVRANCLWLKESDIEHYALCCLSSRAYEAWESFSYQQSLF
jgi:hypothetical protein